MTDARTVRDTATVLLKHKYTVLGVFLLTVAIVTVVTFRLEPRYQATSTLLVRFGREYLYSPEVGENRGQFTATLNRERAVQGEIEILRSPDLARRVVTTLGVAQLYPDLDPASATERSFPAALLGNLKRRITAALSPPGRGPARPDTPPGTTSVELAVQSFLAELSVRGVEASDVVRVSFQHFDPGLSSRAVNLLVEQYQEKRLEAFNNAQASAFLESQVAAYRDRLSAAEARLEGFKQTHGTFSIEEQRTLLLRDRSDLGTALKGAENRVAALERRRLAVEAQLRTTPKEIELSTDTTTPPPPPRNALVDAAKEQLLQLQLKEQQLLAKFRADNALVAQVRREIALVQAFLADQDPGAPPQEIRTVRIGKNAAYVELEKDEFSTRAELEAERTRAAVVREQMKQVERELQALTVREGDLRDLQRDLTTSEQNYQIYARKLEESRISDEMDRQNVTSVRVIQPALTPLEPIWPHRKLNVLVGALVGAVLGVGLALLRESMRRGLTTPEGAERQLGLPVLTTVGHKRA
jgi:uncharacterized protein involved in exopolysaccharide biosynthesis